MTRFAFLASLLLAGVLLAGCSGGDGGPTTTTGPTTTSGGSPSPGVATAIEITRSPASSPAGSNATVCWTITGTGRVAHTAIHWDDESHAAEPGRTFQDYSLGASYPNNQSSADPAGYGLSASGAQFCTAAMMPASGAIFLVAHVIDSTGQPGRLTQEREIRVGPASDAVLHIRTFTYSPNPLIVAPGATVSVRNLDSQIHTVTDEGGSFDTGDVAVGQTKTFSAPPAAGTYAYGCNRHPAMGGVLEVQG